VIFDIVGGAVVLAILVGAVRSGISALGTPHDRSAGNETLRHTAALLAGRFQEREEIPWYRRPAQYGAVEGELDGLRYQLYLMPWNAEDSREVTRRVGGYPDPKQTNGLNGSASAALASASAGLAPDRSAWW
jgi:hypothetical protein